MRTDSNDEGTEAHRDIESTLWRWRNPYANLQMRTYMLGLLDSLDQPTPPPVHDPRPTKGKFEPQHLFNSRMRDWNRRNP